VMSVSVQTNVLRTPQEALSQAAAAFADMPAPMGAGELQDALGEHRPEPVTRTASVPVRLALVDR
jgi:hypothetical protein